MIDRRQDVTGVANTDDAAPAARFDRLDALRGAAMVWMAGFHFCFDLNLNGLLTPRQDFYQDPLWTWQRVCIVSLFLLCAGMGQAVALQRRQSWSRFWRRWAQVAACAVLVSIGSMQMFPRSWIVFGVLHGIAVMLILSRWAAPLRGWLWPLGALAIALPHAVQHPFFDARYSHWMGLVTHKPVTEDWVPVLPWLGVMWWGLAAGQWLLAQRRGAWADAWTGSVAAPLRLLVVLGRWPLTFYMLHQPVLIGALLGGRRLGWW